MKIVCPNCGQHYEVSKDMARETVECEKCGERFVVPKPDPAPAPTPAAAFDNIKPEKSIVTGPGRGTWDSPGVDYTPASAPAEPEKVQRVEIYRLNISFWNLLIFMVGAVFAHAIALVIVGFIVFIILGIMGILPRRLF